ncbi:bifunctional pyr operon transcriptional regulator/uracil phosphoribosyltransferase PyrR [Parvibium lacunae]|uniref:Bifunctional pyr operon transcriptional regulator/uracil phosphoribosyltransferase PyrR n=1 Tax=Parvibium lacunae TaxID=1888893 RepID=A0A368L518_9BURK|nr:bifunctional pyr operon transcriptional regulator/uracil phosphoribosyltransferase PyrR [Parvibium lacunae]RCS58522.1 bifunctional pyr operon transcriptional regulator/uracil phosphoribosyltransferase PyrR [Parvibium lacunae]
MKNVTLLDAESLYDNLKTQLSHNLQARLESMPSREDQAHQQIGLIGIHTGGVWLAERLHQDLRASFPLDAEIGKIDSAFYRDDLKARGLRPNVQPSYLPFSTADKHLILIDDVLYTGRTVRGVLNEIFDYGRPASVTLAVLVDRGGHQLPIHAELAGARMALQPQQSLVLARSPEYTFTLTLEDAA